MKLAIFLSLAISCTYIWSHEKEQGKTSSGTPWSPRLTLSVGCQLPSAQESEELRKRGLATMTAPALAKHLYSFGKTTDFKRLDAEHSSTVGPGLSISLQSWEKSYFSQAFDQILEVK